MSKLTDSDVEHVATLSRLSLNDGEIVKFQKQLSGVVDYISDLQNVETESVQPTSQCTGLEDVVRKDIIKPENMLTEDQAVSGTENSYNGYFKVSAILNERKKK